MSEAVDHPATLILTLEEMGKLGEAVAHHDGATVFVFGGIPGETVEAEVVRQRGKRIAARVVKATSSSPHRIDPPCPYFGTCTGCQWQHIDYEEQVQLKWRMVRHAIAETGGMPDAPVAPVVPAAEHFEYRNHARFTVGPEGTLGFVNRETHRFVRIDRCLLMHPWINRALAQLQTRCGETTQLSIRYGVNTGRWLIQPPLRQAGVDLETGQKHYDEALHSHPFRISAASFFQVNTPQAERMADLVRQRLALTGDETVVDAYAGVGTFAALVAPHARRVIAIEDSPAAVHDAEVNVHATPNVELVRGRTEKALQSLGGAVHALILDPPRVGCHPAALNAIVSQPPKRVVYVSCDPQALARDLRILCHGPFELEEVLPIDLFPHTHHIECIATLTYRDERQRAHASRQRLILASESPRRQEILSDMGIRFDVQPSPVDEAPLPAGDPVALAQQRALHKARAVASTLDCGTVIGADTIVADGEDMLGKPVSRDEAFAMLARLRGQEHRVITGLALVDAASGEELTGYRATRVRMRDYSDDEIAAYIASGDAWDKAGAYAIQDATFHPVARVSGCHLNVVGLPPCTLVRLLERMSIFPAIDPDWRPPHGCRDCHRLAQQAYEARTPRSP